MRLNAGGSSMNAGRTAASGAAGTAMWKCITDKTGLLAESGVPQTLSGCVPPATGG